MFWATLIGLICLKILLMPSYTSTDFEVHRNWLAITYSLPMKQWYTENHSNWTLDYPPFFALFEYLLSLVAYYFDPKMLDVNNLNYKSQNTLLFQRFSVIVMDLFYAYGVKECGRYFSDSKLRKSSKWKSQWNSPSAILIILLLTNATLLLIDHIHFQYNGFLFGILLISVVRMLEDKKFESAVWFLILLNLKHIFMYMAPAYFIYLLRNYCFLGNSVSRNTFSMKNCVKLGLAVVTVFMISFGPFILYGEFFQVLSRLFPFKRGLSHSYWAPNFWALYNGLDRVLFFLGKKLGYSMKGQSGGMTAGLVQQYEHSVLPSIYPSYTFIITFITIIPALWKLWLNPGNPLHFVRTLIICAFSSFSFGWHVHEKAILLPVIPLTLMSVIWRKEAVIFLILSTVGHYSVFPLLYEQFELVTKVSITLIYSVYAFCNLPQLYNVKRSSFSFSLLNHFETLYIFSLSLLFLYEHCFQYMLGLDKKYPFLPLMFTSVHNSCGVIYCYVAYYWYYLKLQDSNHKRKAY
ncbi:probable dolichyl pyrophosphate Glc1Man9GlcNAc2 alpha-1,3-glucosyltransferase [Planococcus citri]|uniref:probable dolichyl pyrophosphate Glc1Man9GlcNAc2 alpha-1,3-glucosyltransferase n=1 Tax=Planococcus citri TaxID=170843 RepID=UPI0031F82519